MVSVFVPCTDRSQRTLLLVGTFHVGSLAGQTREPGDRTRAYGVILLGFSQGPCLILEYAAQHARHYGGVVGLSGGLIGPEGTPRNYIGQLAATSVFLGCSDVDPHIPLVRVHETARVLHALDGEVTEMIYPEMGHGINEDEIQRVRGLLARLGVPGGSDTLHTSGT